MKLTASKSMDWPREAARTQVERKADEIRARFITTGKEGVYLIKRDEAERYLADPAPDLASYPLLSAEIGISASTASDLAALWLARWNDWRAVAAAIEAIEQAAKRDLDALTRPDALDPVVAAALAQLDAIGTKKPRPPPSLGRTGTPETQSPVDRG